MQRLFLGRIIINIVRGFQGTMIYDYDSKDKIWQEYSIVLTSFKSKVCASESNISFAAYLGRVDIISVQDDGNLQSRTPYNTLLLGKRCIFTMTSTSKRKTIVAGGHIDGFNLSSAIEGVLNANENGLDWKELPVLSFARARHVAFNVDNCLYVVGGYVGNDDQVCTTSSEVFDICNGFWTVHPRLPSRLNYLKSVTDRDKKSSLVLDVN